MATAGRHISRSYVMIAGVALALVLCVAAIALLVGAHPAIAERAGRRVARLARRVRRGVDPEKVAQTSGRLVSHARSAQTGRAFLESFGFASADLLRKAGRQRGIDTEAARLRESFRAPQMRQLPLVEDAMGRQALALLGQLAADDLEQAAIESFNQHPDAGITTCRPEQVTVTSRAAFGFASAHSDWLGGGRITLRHAPDPAPASAPEAAHPAAHLRQ